MSTGMKWMKQHRQPLIWAVFLWLLFFIEPSGRFTICPLKLAGANWCPGCGIGHAIHHALHFQFSESLRAHWLGIPATCILIYATFKPIIFFRQNKTYEPANHDATPEPAP